MAALLDAGTQPTTLVSVTPADTPEGERHDRLEEVAAEAAIVASTNRTGGKITIERRRSNDSRNGALRDKYARTRDPAVLLIRDASRAWRETLVRGANVVGRVRRRRSPSLLVVEYNPTLAFNRDYAALPVGRRRLVRLINNPGEILPAVWSGDLVPARPRPTGRAPRNSAAERLARQGDDLEGCAYAVAGVPLWPLVRRRLLALVDRYAGLAEEQAPRMRRALRRWDVEAVLVPYDTNPSVCTAGSRGPLARHPDVLGERRLQRG